MSEPVSAEPRVPIALRLLETATTPLRRMGLAPEPRAEKLLAKHASTRDETLVRCLHAFCEALRVDDSISFFGRTMIPVLIRDLLKQRVCIEAALAANPQIGSIPIERPIFIAGPPRTGTTLLQTLMAQDPDCRWIHAWELQTPRLKSASEWGGPRDRRVKAFEREIKRIRRRTPIYDKVHPLDSPAECGRMVWAGLGAPTPFTFLGMGRVYEKWQDLMAPEFVLSAYRFYRKFLQYLTWVRPAPHWLLKWPEHTIHLPALYAVFPDAAVIQLHRDAAEFVGSFCSSIYHSKILFLRRCDPRAIGRAVQHAMEQWVVKNTQDRGHLADRKILDIRYTDLNARPVETVARIYEFAGRPWTAAVEGNMRRWVGARHADRGVPHKYTLEQFGSSKSELRRAFGEYHERYGVLAGRA